MSDVLPYVVVLEPDAPDAHVAGVLKEAQEIHPKASITRGEGWAAVAVGDGVRPVDADAFRALPGVLAVVPVSVPYRLASRDVLPDDVGVRVSRSDAGEAIPIGGGGPIVVMASSLWGTRSESRLQLLAPLLNEAGCTLLHAGRLVSGPAQEVGGLDLDALARVRAVAIEHGLGLCVEVGEATLIRQAEELVDVLQVGSHSMQDFSLLREMGRARRPVILRRGVGATVEEFLLAAEYVLSHGNGSVILCESGIRTFDSQRHPRFEVGAIPVIRHATHLPLIADASHAAPHADVVPALAKAAVAAGADGLVLEVTAGRLHDEAGTAIGADVLRRLMAELRPIARAVGRAGPAITQSSAPAPRDADGMLRITDRTLAQAIESVVGLTPDLDVTGQWRLAPPATAWLSPPLSADAEIHGRCTGYRMGAVRLSRNIAYVDPSRIDPTLAILLETRQLNLGQLFVDPRIEKLNFEFGTNDDAGEIDGVLRTHFPGEIDDLDAYVWRRYQATIGGVVAFVVIESLPTRTWERLLRAESLALQGAWRR